MASRRKTNKLFYLAFLLTFVISSASGFSSTPASARTGGSSKSAIPAHPSLISEPPGGPILIITTAANAYGEYYREILQTEGFNAFAVQDITTVTPEILNGYDLVLLGEMPLSTGQVSLLTDWVSGGGNLIAMRPDKQLAGLLGLADAGAVITDGYTQIHTGSAPGAGITGVTMQIHGAADAYTLGAAAELADLYQTLAGDSSYPAVTLNSYGAGKAAAFAYDLAKSVVLTRQGDPGRAGYDDPSTNYYMAVDLFLPDWEDFNRITVPQADEQQRFLANLILHMNLDKKPLPRFWYLPRGEKAAVIMTGDDHVGYPGQNPPGHTSQFFQRHIDASPPGCSVEDWECVRSSSYMFQDNPMTDAQALAFTQMGFEIGLHPMSSRGSASWCANWTSATIEPYYTSQLDALHAKFPSLPVQASERNHCYAWYGYADQAKVNANHGIRMNVNMTYHPTWYINGNYAGYHTGTAFPMRFADTNGALIDVYNAPTILTDDNGGGGAWLPAAVGAMLDRAIGPEGYFTAFVVNMHSDNYAGWSYSGSDMIVAAAQARSVPVISGRQMTEWLDSRNASFFSGFTYDGAHLGFTITPGAGARGLQAMLPRSNGAAVISEILLDGAAIPFTIETIKGIDYAIFSATTGAYQALYEPDTTPPAISVVTAQPSSSGTALITWTTHEPASSRVNYGVAPAALAGIAEDPALTTEHSLTLSGLAPRTTYYYRITSTDEFANSTTWPDPGLDPADFYTPQAELVDTTTQDFNAGVLDPGIAIDEQEDGEVILKPAATASFNGSSLPTGWSWNPFVGGGSAVLTNGLVRVDGARVQTDAYYSAGHTLEGVVTFHSETFQHFGFGTTYSEGPWAIFSTKDTTNSILARTNVTTDLTDDQFTVIPGITPGSPHTFRIVWLPDRVEYYVDGNPVATHNLSFALQMRPVVGDSSVSGATVDVDNMTLGPYAAAGSFDSRVFDSHGTAYWGAMNWLANVPANTGLVVRVRTGDTLTPDASWSEWVEIPVPGADIPAVSRYIQYRLELVTADPMITPVVRQVAIGYDAEPDLTPPQITSRIPAPGVTGVYPDADVTVTFNEPMEPTSIHSGSFRLRMTGAADDVPASITYSGQTATLNPSSALAADVEYQVTVAGSVTDLSGNTLGADDVWTFTTTQPPGTPWMDPAWDYRRPVTVTCPCGQDTAEYQVQISLNSSNFDFSQARADGSDLRVTSEDGQTLIPYWIESWDTTGQQASLWVKVPSLPLSGATLYLYYGNETPAAGHVEMPPTGPWTKAAGNPIVPIGGPADGKSLLAENIVYDEVTGHYWMVHANYNNGSVGLVWSDTPANPASWNWFGTILNSANAPHLLKHAGTWYVFFSDWTTGEPSQHSIQVAESTSVTGPYTNRRTILSPTTGSWENWRVDEPFVFQRNDGKWILLYMGDGGDYLNGQRYYEQVGYAIADSPTGPYTKFDGNPALAWGPSGSFDAGTIADPWVVELNGVYYIGYTVSPTIYSPWQTAYATTTDWQTFVKHNLTLTLGPSGAWDNANTFRGAVTRTGDTYVFAYTGDGFQMGLATQPAYSPVNDESTVFPFFDEFNDGAFDAAKWRITAGTVGMLSESGGNLTLTSVSQSSYIKINGQANFGLDYLVETRARHPQAGTSLMIAEAGLSGDSFTDTVRFANDFHNTAFWEYQSRLASTPGDPWTTSAFPVDTGWHTLRVYRQTPNLAGFQVDTLPLETTTASTPTASLAPFLMSFGNSNQVIVDWIRVRKWCGADAVATVGAVELPVPEGRIQIEKSGDAQVLGGSPVSFNITITNTGDFELSNVAVSDPLAPACNRSGLVLPIGGEITYTCTLPNAASDFTNSATASGMTPGGVLVTSTDTFAVDVIHPAVTIDIQPPAQNVLAGDPANFTVQVTNSGDTPLQNVAVADPDVPDCNRSIGGLDPAAHFSYTCSQPAVSASFSHTVTVTGQPGTGPAIQGTDTANVTAVDIDGQPWIDADWLYRRPLHITNTCSQALSDYQVQIQLNSTNFDFQHSQPDGSDLRITLLDGVTLLPYWIESWDAGTQQASVWIKAPNISLTGAYVYLYYGNPAATPASAQPESIFLFYDSFNGAQLDAAKWRSLYTEPSGTVGSATVAGGILSVEVSSTSGAFNLVELLSQPALGVNVLQETYASHPQADGSGHTAAELGFGVENRAHMIRLMDYDNPNFLINTATTSGGGNTIVALSRPLETGYLLHRIYRTADGQVQFGLANDPWQTLTANVPTLPLPIWFMVFAVPGYTGELNVDWTRARSFCGSEPGAEWFPEQVGNSRPIANGDAYTTPFNLPLHVPAPGVLGNDTDANSDPLTAVQATDPAHGDLLLNPDGSFDYTPDNGFAGDDSFTYKANDGQDDSRLAATVTITVLPPPEPICTTLQRGTLGVVEDSYIWDALPANDYTDSPSLYTGLRNHVTAGLKETRLLLRFPLSELPAGALIQSAELGLTVFGGPAGEPIQIHALTAPWSEAGGTSWTALHSAFDLASLGSFHTVSGAVSADITALVQAWASGAHANNGMMLINSGAQANNLYRSSEYTTIALRPKLAVCYWPSAGPAVSIDVTPASASLTAGASQAYQVTARDADGRTWDVTLQSLLSIDPAAGGAWNANTYTSEAQGDWTVTAAYSGLTDTAALAVQHGPAASLSISPASTTLTAGQSVTYQATAADASGNTWDVTSETAFSTPTEAGGAWSSSTYTSEKQGDWTVTASYSGRTGTAALTVQHATAAGLVLTPASTTITAGQTVAYQATASDSFGNVWDVTTESTFSIQTGAGGAWSANTYTSANAGVWDISAGYAGLEATALLSVLHGAAVSIELTPATDTLTAGESVTYHTSATDAYGNTWDVTAESTFSIETGAGGAWSANAYTSELQGDWTVTGSYSGLTDTAALTVQHAAPVALEVTPATASITAGQTAAYHAAASDSFGNTWDVTAETTFSTPIEAGGTWSANTYTGEKQGDWTVTASYSSLTDTAALTVQHAAAASLALTPPSTTVAAGQTVTYHANASDSFGNTWDVTAESTFSIEAGAGGSWSANTYTSANAGVWNVSAGYAGLEATALLSVVHGVPVSIELTPAAATLTVGQTVTYLVTASDGFGNTWDATADSTFGINPEAGGSWSANTYTSQNDGDWTVTATYEARTDTAQLTVEPLPPYQLWLPIAIQP